MVNKFKPLDYSPSAIYDPRYWSIFLPDAIGLVSALATWGITKKVPPAPKTRILKFCGNPQCMSPFAYLPDKKPYRCGVCGGVIDWSPPQSKAIAQPTGRKCPNCGYTTNDFTITMCPYEEETVYLV